MVSNFYQNKIQPTINKTTKMMGDTQTIPIAFLTSLFSTLIIMVLFNFPNSIMNTTELDVIILGNVFLGFALFSLIFTLLASITIACIFSIIMAPKTKKQLVEFKDACVDYARIFRTLRVQRYELDEERLIKLFDNSLDRKMKEYGVVHNKPTKEAFTEIFEKLEKTVPLEEYEKLSARLFKAEEKIRQLQDDHND